MVQYGFYSLFLGFLICFFSCSLVNKGMSTDEKVEDFEFLYQTLKDNYPFFGITQRESGVDWLSRKNEYINKIKATPNDSAYLFTLVSIIGEIRGSHLGIYPTFNHKLFTDTYKQGAVEKPKYQKWVEVLVDKNERSDHWMRIWKKRWRDFRETNQTVQTTVQNYSDSTLVNDNIAIMRFKSFGYNDFMKDTLIVASYFEKIKNFDYLIIDIQDNGGGSDNSWKHIVGKIIETPVTFPRYQIIKDGALNRHFYPEPFENGTVVQKNDSLPDIPEEILDGSFFLYLWTDTIIPKNPIPFKGKIFLLVNEKVFSASEGFAYFCKITRWATVAGITTFGDGACGEPTLFMLPKSGITLNHPSLVGLNSDGSLNYETKTVPDVQIAGRNPDDRLNNLIKHLKTSD